MRAAGLALPFLQGTWRYALWASDGTSERLLGTFSSPLFADDDFSSAPTRGAASTGFAAPGQDFVTAATVPALVPSAKKMGGPGSPIDVPLGHKDAAYVRSHFDAMEVRLNDSPRANEILVAVVVTDSGRPSPRIGGLTTDQVEGKDGLR